VTEIARVEVGQLDGAHLVRVSGEIDLSNARAVMGAIGEGVPHDVTLVVVDLSGTAYLDSAGIAMIFRLAERLGNSRQQLHLVVPRDAPIRAVLELTKLTEVIPVREALTEISDPT
jgi:anti-anti-sigma factor